MDTDSFIFDIKEKTFTYNLTSKQDVKARFETSYYEFDRPLPKGKNKKVIGLMKGELGGKIQKELAVLRAKAYSYLTDKNDKDKASKRHKKVCHSMKSYALSGGNSE